MFALHKAIGRIPTFLHYAILSQMKMKTNICSFPVKEMSYSAAFHSTKNCYENENFITKN